MGESDISKIIDRLDSIEGHQKEHATEFFKRLDDQSGEIAMIKTALIGNAEFKQPGLVDRVATLEDGHEAQADKIGKNTLAAKLFAGSIMILGVALGLLKFFKG